MRFLILTQYYPPEIGAPQVRLAALAAELVKLNHRVEIVTAIPHHLIGRMYPGYERKIFTREISNGATVTRTWAFAASGTGFPRLLNYLSFSCSSLIGLFTSSRPDYIFVESPPLFLGVSAWLYARVKRAPIIFNVADLWPDSVRELGVLSPGWVYDMAEHLERWIYRKSSFVNAATNGILNTLRDTKGVPASKLLFLPNGVDTDLFFPRPPDKAFLQNLDLVGKKTILYAGTFGAAQGLGIVIDCAAALRELNIVFLLVGEGHTKKALIELARARRLDNVRFMDAQPLQVMPRLFSLATASIVPLVKRDLFKSARPSKIFASLASGVPVLYCGEGEAGELIRSHEAGIVTPPEDAAALSASVRNICEQPEMRDLMSRNARELAVREFDWSAIVANWLRSLVSQEQTASVARRSECITD